MMVSTLFDRFPGLLVRLIQFNCYSLLLMETLAVNMPYLSTNMYVQRGGRLNASMGLL